MELVNQTAVPAHLWVADTGGELRTGVLTAKATFHIRDGRAELDDQTPVAIGATGADGDGALREVISRELPGFEVMLVGSVEAPPGGPIDHARVRLSVGDECREMNVFGDRHWVDTENGPAISEPAPFLRMPLDWTHAYGGTADIEVDRSAVVRLVEPLNPLGRGFDVETLARCHSRAMGAPEAYPIVEGSRPLPNLENPAQRIAAPDDAPLPWCWAPVPNEAMVRHAPVLDALGDPSRGAAAAAPTVDERREIILATLRQAHPCWRIDRPREGARVDLMGMLATGSLTFALPSLRVVADYVIGDRHGVRELAPQSLLIVANDGRICILYRSTFRVGYEVGVERGFRLRLESGWYGSS